MVLKLKRLWNLGSKSLIQWIGREWVRKLDSNKSDNNYSESRWPESKDKLVLFKENRHRHNPRRCVLVYISFLFDYKSNFCRCSVFLSLLWSPFLRIFFLFYIIFLPPSPPSMCKPGCWRWFLSHQHLPEVSKNSCKPENYCSRIIFTLMRP